MADPAPGTVQLLLKQGEALVDGLNCTLDQQTDFQALAIESWLTDVHRCATGLTDRTSLLQLDSMVKAVKNAVAQAQATTKEKLLQSKRGSKGKHAYQQQK